ncbi:MAG: pre-peptidase C-terminal domain-containing protein [Promethearchaeota archaeon]
MKYLVLTTIVLLYLSSLTYNTLINVNPTDTSIQENKLRSSATAFSDDFESGLTQWASITGMWHLTDSGSSWPNPYHSPTHSMWFGDESTGTYNSTSQEYGEMVSISFSLVGYTTASLSFYHWRECEENPGYDVSYVDISINGIDWYNIYTYDDYDITPWKYVILDISGYVGSSSVQLRFSFDTIDDLYNDYRGWLVDDILVSDTPVPTDDNYEENDDYTTAYDLSAYEDTWLSTINGSGIQADDDWYEIYISPGDLNLQVILTFTHAEGDIDIDVYSSTLSYIAGNSSITDNEYINVLVPSSGTYYLYIYFANAGNTYDLWWDDLPGAPPTDDNYEENDDYTTAYNLSLYEDIWLSTIDGSGVQLDNDWYEIQVDPGYEHLLIWLTFTHADGNMDIFVFNSSLSLITANMSTTDNEYINYIVPSNGLYYVMVYGEDAGNEYDLWWDDLSTTDDNYEENDDYISAYDLSGDKNVWLNTIDGYGVQFDDDWYEFTIDPDYTQLIADLTFTHIADNLDLEIYDSTGTLIIASTSSTDNEHIDYVLPFSGTYYIRVYGNDIGNEYNLRWNSKLPDDNYEENDDSNSAYALSEDTLLNGVQLDDDWYEISILEGYENVTIILTFIHSAGNINLALYNSTSDLITSSTSTTDNEYINYIVSSSGTYYIRVYGDDVGNSYTLIWSSTEYTPPGDGRPAVPGYALLYLVGIIFIISALSIRNLNKRKALIHEKF